MSEWIKKIVQYITKDIWVKKEHEYKSRRTRWAVRQFKVFIFTAQGIGQHSILVRSAALTFYTLMSLVPIAALVFSVMKGFGFEARLNEYLHEQFPQYRVLIDQVLTFANAMIQRTKGGVIASVGVVVLFWSVIKVFNYVESSFNSIWEVRRSALADAQVQRLHDGHRHRADSVGSSRAASASRYSSTCSITPRPPIVNVLLGTLSTLVIWTMFTFVYLVMPNTKVKLRSALTAGIMAGTIFVLFQLAYVFIQSRLTNYNAIYGSFAAVPPVPDLASDELADRAVRSRALVRLSEYPEIRVRENRRRDEPRIQEKGTAGHHAPDRQTFHGRRKRHVVRRDSSEPEPARTRRARHGFRAGESGPDRPGRQPGRKDRDCTCRRATSIRSACTTSFTGSKPPAMPRSSPSRVPSSRPWTPSCRR